MDLQIYDKAIKLLSIRMHTTGELMRKLQDRGFRDEDIRPVLQRLEELKFLDDQRFAEIFVDNLKRYKTLGYYGIKAKLQHRLIPSDIVANALAEYFTGEDELLVVERLVEKLKKQGKTRDQIMRSLANKGFRSEVIHKFIRRSTG